MRVYKKHYSKLRYRINGYRIEFTGGKTDKWFTSQDYNSLVQFRKAIEQGLLVPIDIQEPKLEEVDW